MKSDKVNVYQNQELTFKIPTWKSMINFDDSPKLNSLLVLCAYIYGWMYNLFLFDISTFSWEFLIKGIMGLMFAVLTAFCIRVVNIFVDTKIKTHKYFTNAKKNNERRA